MSLTEDNGVSRLETLFSLIDAGVEIDEDLPRRPPIGCEYLWEIYLEINPLQFSGMSAGFVIPTEVFAYCDKMGYSLCDFEYEIIFQLHRIYLKSTRKVREAEKKRRK